MIGQVAHPLARLSETNRGPARGGRAQNRITPRARSRRVARPVPMPAVAITHQMSTRVHPARRSRPSRPAAPAAASGGSVTHPRNSSRPRSSSDGKGQQGCREPVRRLEPSFPHDIVGRMRSSRAGPSQPDLFSGAPRLARGSAARRRRSSVTRTPASAPLAAVSAPCRCEVLREGCARCRGGQCECP